MSFPFDEEPITAEEERLIGEASGHLHDRCEQAIGTSKEDQVEAEHDAMMRLRRRHRQVEAALAAKDAEIAALKAALEKAADQLSLVHDDAFKQAVGYGLVTSDGREFSCFQLNQCQTAATAARAALKEKVDA